MSEQITPDVLRICADESGRIAYRSRLYAAADALEAAHKRIAELEAELDAARRWYRL